MEPEKCFNCGTETRIYAEGKGKKPICLECAATDLEDMAKRLRELKIFER